MLFLKLETIWVLADIVNGLMAIPNLIALLGLSGVVVAETKAYFTYWEKCVPGKKKLILLVNLNIVNKNIPQLKLWDIFDFWQKSFFCGNMKAEKDKVKELEVWKRQR